MREKTLMFSQLHYVHYDVKLSPICMQSMIIHRHPHIERQDSPFGKVDGAGRRAGGWKGGVSISACKPPYLFVCLFVCWPHLTACRTSPTRDRTRVPCIRSVES